MTTLTVALDEPLGPGFFLFFQPEEEITLPEVETTTSGRGVEWRDYEYLHAHDVEMLESILIFLLAVDE